jgi:6-phosphogluconolactonase (cycloisomerase 2 family)
MYLWGAAAALSAFAFACRHPGNSNRRTSPTPQKLRAPAGYVYITNNGEGTVSEFARERDGGLIFLRLAKAGALSGPTGIAIDPAGRFVYVANERDRQIHIFRIRRETGDLAPAGAAAVDTPGRPQQIAIGGRFLYVTSASNVHDGAIAPGTAVTGSISEFRIDAATGELQPMGVIRGGSLREPLGLALAPNRRFAYVYDIGAGTLLSFAIDNAGGLRPVASTPSLGDRPGHPGLVAVHPSGNFVYTVDRRLGSVVVARTSADGRLDVTHSYRAGISTATPFGIAVARVDSTVFVYTGNRGSDTVATFAVKPDLLDLVGECPTGLGYPTGMTMDPEGRNLYVVNRNAATVVQFAVAESKGATLVPAASLFTEAAPTDFSHPLYIATTRWDAPAPR